MRYHIKELLLTEGDFSRYSITGQPDRLSPLSKVNLFVGANNSGKSRLLREIAAIKKLSFVPNRDISVFENTRAALSAAISAVCQRHNITDAGGYLQTVMNLPPLVTIDESEPFVAGLQSLLKSIATREINGFSVTSGGWGGNHEGILRDMKAAAEPFHERIDSAVQAGPTGYDFVRVYIPTLRGLRSFENHSDRYEERTRADYFVKANHVNIFTGLTLYQELTKLLLGTLAEREAAAEFERFLSEAFFDGQPVALIPRFGQDVLDVKIGDEAQRPIFSLGDGIQSIIILTFPLFQHRDKNLLLFIEEPELFMHPGLQRVLLNVLMRFPNAQYFLATHSNHLLDLTLDVEEISVFTFRKNLEESDKREKDAVVTVSNVSNEDERSLTLLGIKNSSVFLSNCTIWVEGITDRRYFAHYLNLYQEHLRTEAADAQRLAPKRFRQDLHYSFVEYAGANITHFSFLDSEADPIVVDRLCAKLFLITDKDGEANTAKQERHASLQEKLGDRYYCLRCREVENLLTPRVITEVIRSYEGSSTELATFSASAYQNQPLGRFIETKVIKGQKSRRASYQGKSGTISDKITFCQRALEQIRRFSDLSEEAQQITKRLYDFIHACNS